MTDSSPISLRLIIFSFIISLFILLILFTYTYFSTETKVVFCPVPEGTVIYIRTRDKYDILINSGPNKKILECIGKYMPFYDKSVELAIITDGTKNNIGAFQSLIDRYKFNLFWLSSTEYTSKDFTQLLSKLEEKNIPIKLVTTGEKILLGSSEFEVLWPPTEQETLSTKDRSMMVVYKEGYPKTLITGNLSKKVFDMAQTRGIFEELEGIPLLQLSNSSKSTVSRETLQSLSTQLTVVTNLKENINKNNKNDVMGLLNNLNITHKTLSDEAIVYIIE